MNEPKPLCIEFVVDQDRGVYFGWNLDREKINPYSLGIWEKKSMGLVKQWVKDGTLVGRVSEQIRKFFSGALASDLKIPAGYPYQLYEKGRELPCSEGRLRDEPARTP